MAPGMWPDLYESVPLTSKITADLDTTAAVSSSWEISATLAAAAYAATPRRREQNRATSFFIRLDRSGSRLGRKRARLKPMQMKPAVHVEHGARGKRKPVLRDRAHGLADVGGLAPAPDWRDTALVVDDELVIFFLHAAGHVGRDHAGTNLVHVDRV